MSGHKVNENGRNGFGYHEDSIWDCFAKGTFPSGKEHPLDQERRYAKER